MKKISLIALASLLLTTHAFPSGQNGRPGPDRIITAGPEFFDINLSGGHGQHGADGRTGSYGSCSTPDSDGNPVGANTQGANGEDGENGGNGGNGGNLTILFSDWNYLKKVFFVSKGGSGGVGGIGGEGGWGCPDGRRGDDGIRGKSGERGNLYLVPKEFLPYKKDNSHSYTTIKNLMEGVELVKNIWSLRNENPIAEGSIYGNGYLLSGYESGFAKVQLTDPDNVDPRVLEENVGLKMDQEVSRIILGDKFTAIASHSDPAPEALLLIKRIYLTHEFNSAKFQTVSGKSGYRKLKIKTLVDLKPRPALTMHLKVEVRGAWWKYRQIFEGEVGEEFIKAVKSGYEIDLDALPLKEKIPAGARIRLTMKHQLKEMNLLSDPKQELWVLNVD